MPYAIIKKGNGRYALVNKNTGKPIKGTSTTRSKAESRRRAIAASEVHTKTRR